MTTATPGHPANSKSCFHIFPFPGNPTDDLTGKYFSGLEVIGYAGRKTGNPGSKWVCRCKCGRYEIRRSRPLKKQNSKKVYLCSVCESVLNNERYKAVFS